MTTNPKYLYLNTNPECFFDYYIPVSYTHLRAQDQRGSRMPSSA